MKTIKIPYSIHDSDNLKGDSLFDLDKLRKQYTSILKFSYNRFKDGLGEKDIRGLIKNLKNIDLLDSWFIQSAIKEANFVFNSIGQEKLIFNKQLFLRRLKGNISKTEYKTKKDAFAYIYSVGEKLQKGNRKFDFDLSNNKVVFKPKKGVKIDLLLPKLRKSLKEELFLLDKHSKLKTLPISIKLSETHIYIIFEETLIHKPKIYKFNENKALGIDINPNFIGLSVLKFNDKGNYKIIKRKCFNLEKLTSLNNHNKHKHEVIEITKQIVKFAKHNKVGFIFNEELKMKSKNLGKGRKTNKLVMNQFLRTLFQTQLKKRCKLNSISFFKVFPQYTSFIGNMQHSCIDPINASIEIARRGYEVIILKNKRFYPNILIKQELKDQQKESFNNCKSWIELFKLIKNTKMRYRVSLEELNSNSSKVFELKTHKSKVSVYDFI